MRSMSLAIQEHDKSRGLKAEGFSAKASRIRAEELAAHFPLY